MTQNPLKLLRKVSLVVLHAVGQKGGYSQQATGHTLLPLKDWQTAIKQRAGVADCRKEEWGNES